MKKIIGVILLILTLNIGWCAKKELTYYEHYRKAISLNEQKDTKGAIKALDKAVEISPNFINAYKLRGAIKYYQKEQVESLKDYLIGFEYKLLANENEEIEELVDEISEFEAEIRELFTEEDYRKLIKEYTRQIVLIPNKEELYLRRAFARVFIDELKKAEDDYEKVLNLNPNNFFALLMLANITEDNKKGIILFEKLIEIDPNNSKLYKFRAYDLSLNKEGQTVVTMWVMPNSLEPIYDLAAVLEDFHKENPKIKVQVRCLDWGSAWQRITIASMYGEGPDIFQLATTWVGPVTGMGIFADLTGKVSELGGSSYFLPSSWKYAGIDGSNAVTSIPWFVDARTIYYRTDVFNRLGLTKNDLATWESFQNTLEKIQKANLTIDGKKVYPLGITGKNDWNVVHNLAPWIWMAGGDFLKEGNKECALYSNEAASGLSYLVNLVIKGYVPASCLEQHTSQVENAFNNGEYAIIFAGSNELRALTTSEEQGGAANTYVAKRFDIAPYPEGPKGKATFVGGSNLSVFKNSKNKDAAWEVIKYLVGKKAQVEYSKRSGFLPSAMEAFDDPYFTQDARRLVYREAVKYGRAYPCISEWAEFEQQLNRRFSTMWKYVLDNREQVTDEYIYEDVLKKTAIEVDKLLLMNR